MEIPLANSYIESLKKTKKDLEFISFKLKDMTYIEEWEKLYEQEFYLSMRMSGIYEDAHCYLDNIKNNDIMVRKYKKQLNEIFSPLSLDLIKGG